MPRPIDCIALLLVLAPGAAGVVSAQSAVVDFESITAGTPFGGATNAPGDRIFSQNGVDVTVETNAAGSFSRATVGGFTDPSFPTTPATISNINLRFDFAGVGFPVGLVTFEFVDFGGVENLGVNDSFIQLVDLEAAPAVIGGASVSVVADGSGSAGTRTPGLVTISGDIDSIIVGGQEFGIDNVLAVIPEPAAALLLLGGAGAASGWRRRRR